MCGRILMRFLLKAPQRRDGTTLHRRCLPWSTSSRHTMVCVGIVGDELPRPWGAGSVCIRPDYGCSGRPLHCESVGFRSALRRQLFLTIVALGQECAVAAHVFVIHSLQPRLSSGG